MILVDRHGTFYRVCESGWDDPLDTSFSRRTGGRWNPAGEFGALYLNATMDVARANARHLYSGSFYQPEDLTGTSELQLLEIDVQLPNVVDCATPEGLQSCGLPIVYPLGFERDHEPSRTIARRAFTNGDSGVASRSAAECAPHHYVGEELAIFDRAAKNIQAGKRYPFAEWYYAPPR